MFRFGLYLLPFSMFVVGGGIFPFITGKNFFFRMAVEILFVLWACVVVLDKKLRPKPTPLFWTLIISSFLLILSAIFGVNPHASFWSNYERMEGMLGNLHFLAYFLIISSVFIHEIDWKRFFLLSIFISLIVSIHGYFQYFGITKIFQSGSRIDSVFGNSIYLAVYILFHLFLVTYFFFKEKTPGLKQFLGAVFLFELPILFFTATRGAILGFLIGIFLLTILYAIFSKNHNFKKISLAVLLFMVLSASLFWVFRHSSFIQNNSTLNRIANISLSEQTASSRFLLWKIAWSGFKERPILGWGPENFLVVYNKFYNPQLWSQEPFFDRAHNIVFDKLVVGGILGFIAYLSIFISALYMLYKKREDTALLCVFTALFAAYFFSNLFAFDQFSSYFMFFSVLGFINFKYLGSASARDDFKIKGDFVPVLSLSAGILAVPLYFFNVKPLSASYNVVDHMQYVMSAHSLDIAVGKLSKAISRTFDKKEVLRQLLGYTEKVINSNFSDKHKQTVLDLALPEFENQVKKNPLDLSSRLALSRLYFYAQRFDEALVVAQDALMLSPKKQMTHFVIADILYRKGNLEKSLETLETAFYFDPSYYRVAKHVVTAAKQMGRVDYARKFLNKNFGDQIIADHDLLAAYKIAGDYKKVHDILMKFTAGQTAHYFHVELAENYLKLGNRAKAIEQLKLQTKLVPDFAKEEVRLINEINSGRDPF